jgi:excinuclease ABC subunit B
VGINLLREGLDIPEVSLVAILDADKEGFLRSTRSLIQTCGRASRNSRGRVIMYADVVTHSMSLAIEETNRRRKIQQAYNRVHNITPETIQKDITQVFDFSSEQEDSSADRIAETVAAYKSLEDIDSTINSLKKEMARAAKDLEFERAAEIRDEIRELQKLIVLEA